MQANNVEIKGIPVKKSKNLYDIVDHINKVIQCSLRKEDINYIVRVPNLKAESQRSIIIALNNRYCKEEFVAAARKHKELKVSQLGYADEGHVYVNDHLTLFNKAILKKAKDLAKTKKKLQICVDKTLQDSGPKIRHITDVPHKIRKRSSKIFIKLIKCVYFDLLIACTTYCSRLYYFNSRKYCDCCARDLGSPDSFVLLIAITRYLYAVVISEGTSVNSYRNCIYLECDGVTATTAPPGSGTAATCLWPCGASSPPPVTRLGTPTPQIFGSKTLRTKAGLLAIHICTIYLCKEGGGYSINTQLYNFASKLGDNFHSAPNDLFMVLEDFNMPNISWILMESGQLGPMGVLNKSPENFLDIINECNLDQYNNIRNSNDRLLDDNEMYYPLTIPMSQRIHTIDQFASN
ncbi:unnamed protein product [Parnassius apollo]|uniref:(apollo) hypothetical protein n=1 Tax=Parnassius apollo TaxID=110799 RepID=A0A8S3WX22_PARAO|nr:unnamed protein product [Parnassius apollo]